MAATNTTLISLAILKVDLDEGFRDYIGYFENFVISLLRKHELDPIVASEVAVLFQAEYGLRVPEKGIQLVLRRLVKRKRLQRANRQYHIVGQLPKVDLQSKRAFAQEHIDNVYAKLRKYTKSNFDMEWTNAEANQALLRFLSKFSVEFIRAYVYSTALPELRERNRKDELIVSKFIRDLYDSRDRTFESVVILVKGQMYANALICPDLESIQKNFKRIIFYFDTPVVLSALGFHSEAEVAATRELLRLLVRLSGRLEIFSHTVTEIDTVLEYAENHIDRVSSSGRVVAHFREVGMKRGDIALFRGKLDEELTAKGFKIRNSPKYIDDYQIDEALLEGKLRDAINYRGTRGAEHDTNSVRSIFVLRRGSVPRRLEDCRAVFVTDNSKFAETAFEYGQGHNSTREVSSVITDYCLANVAWLKAPLGAPDLPEKETMAACYAALEPSAPLWDKYLAEVDAMREKGSITADDHALLRVSGIGRDELMRLTIGDEKAFGSNSIPQILSRVKSSLVADQVGALNQAREDQSELLDQKRVLEARVKQTSAKLYWASGKIASVLTTILLANSLVLIGIASFQATILTRSWVQESTLATSLTHAIVILVVIVRIASWYYGLSLRSMGHATHKWIHGRIFTMVKRWLLAEDNTSAVQ